MSGIIGKLSFEHDETLARPILEQMLVALRHRHAAATNIHIARGIALGAADDQQDPAGESLVATNARRTVYVVADAQLANSAELVAELERKGHHAHGRSDAQVIALAYEAWGDSCVEHLRGPFACAIWDDAHQRLVLARDPLGIRPLFFAVLHGHGVVFGSEIRALLQDPGVGREWCPQAIDAYLALGYVPAPLTVYQRISKVEPAQRLIVDGRRLHVEQYWDFPTPAHLEREAPLVTVLEDALRHAVDAELTDSANAGVLFSGGVASAAVLVSTTRRTAPVITVAMDEDAAAVARSHATATRLGFAPRVEVAGVDVCAIAAELATHLDEPLADPAAISQYATFLAAREHVTCALTGHGAATFWSSHGTAAPLDRGRSLWPGEHRRELYTRGFAWEVRHADPFARYADTESAHSEDMPFDRESSIGARTWLPDSSLVMAECAASAAGLRLRFPFLTQELVDLAVRVHWATPPRRQSVDPLGELVARRVPYSLLPPAATRPVHPWLAGALAVMVPAILLGRRFDGRGIVSRVALQQLWDEHASGRRNHSHRLWSLLMLEFWFREFIDGDAIDEPLEYAILRAA